MDKSFIYVPNSSEARYGYLWPTALLLSLSLVLLLALGMLFFNGSPRGESNLEPLQALSSHSESVAEKLLPAVVRVFVKKRDSAQTADDLAIYFGDTLTLPREDLGSGMFIDEHGLVLTNYHVVRDASSIEVAAYDGRRAVASIVGADSLTDLAVIKTSLEKTPTIDWDEETHVGVGALVWAFGSPFGLDNSVTLGIVSSTRNAAISDSPFQDFLQTDVAINPGSSGGPLVNVAAKVIGVNTAIAGDRFQGVSFAIPSSLARTVAKELAQNGKIERGWLGVELSAMDSERARQANLPQVRGVYIQSTQPAGTKDDQNRLQSGDICLEIEGRSVNDPVQFSRTVAAAAVGREIRLLVRRGGRDLPISVLVAPRPRDSR